MQVADRIKAGNGVILSLETGALDKNRNVKSSRPFGGRHAVSVTGVEFNARGEPVGLWLHDTGVHSTMGTEFFCSAADFDMIRRTPGGTVQFVWKKANGI